MKNLTQNFGTVFPAIKAFVFRREFNNKKNIYVEAYDFDDRAYPINAHPLTEHELNSLVSILKFKDGKKRAFLKPDGLMPKNILHLDHETGYVIWHTPVKKTDLFFNSNLGVQEGKVFIPAMIWKATAKSLKVYAIKDGSNITRETKLYNAPFYNIYEDGRVCMGNVKLEFTGNCSLDDFMKKWETYFFNSYFSHHIDAHNPIKENLIILWKSLMNTNAKFPLQKLVQSGYTLNKILL